LNPSLLAPGPHPRRELTPMLPLGSACPRGRMAAGAHLFHGRRSPTSSTSRRSSPRICMSSGSHGRRRPPLPRAPGPPLVDLPPIVPSDFHVLGVAWPQALTSSTGAGAPHRRPHADRPLGFPCPRGRLAAGAHLFHGRRGPHRRPHPDAPPRICMSSGSHGRRPSPLP